MRFRIIPYILAALTLCSCSALQKANDAAWERSAQVQKSQRGYSSPDHGKQGSVASSNVKEKVRDKLYAMVRTPDHVDKPEGTREMKKRERKISREKGGEIVSYASEYLGRPYGWGCTGPDRFDCSGFVQFVYRHFGYELPRVAGDQFASGKKVGMHHLKPGDLVVFARGGYMFHIGIVTETDGDSFQFIHASNSGVMVNSSKDAYWSRYFYGASRVI